jgi:hypothetical protein
MILDACSIFALGVLAGTAPALLLGYLYGRSDAGREAGRLRDEARRIFSEALDVLADAERRNRDADAIVGYRMMVLTYQDRDN